MSATPTNDLTSSSQRRAPRESYFLMTTLRTASGEELGKARVRNLSAVGLMADFARRIAPGTALQMDIRGVGIVSGSVSWSKDGRIGIAFGREIDPTLARRGKASSQADGVVPPFLRTFTPQPSTRRA